MNILVTGANGQLGNEIRIVAKDSKHNYFFTDVEELDITNKNNVITFVRDNNINVIINCAASTNVDKAEDDRELAEKLNATAVDNLAEAIKDNQGFIIHISTDYVFGGNKNNTPIKEDESANPTGVYGRTKLLGENIILSSGCKYIIIRTSWLYSEFGKNFVKTMLNLTETKKELKVVFDQTGTPTYALDLAKVIYNIVENELFEGNEGIYHFSNEGVCSWYDFTKEIARISNHNTCNIQPCHSNEFPSKVIRPSYSVLDKTKIKQTFNTTIPYWKESLKICIQNLINNQ